MSTDLVYLTPFKKTRCHFTVQGSRFIATICPAATKALALENLDTISAEFPDASHHTYAYRIGTGLDLIERTYDDREPAGSAGLPMLQVLQGKNVSDAIVVGTRYFGGTKLGIGGLTRAYRDCARQSLQKTILIEKEPLDNYFLELFYEDLGTVTRIIGSLNGTVLTVDYSEVVAMRVSIPSRSSAVLLQDFESACRGRGEIHRQMPSK
jgi:uncharacterized YigZ family protein